MEPLCQELSRITTAILEQYATGTNDATNAGTDTDIPNTARLVVSECVLKLLKLVDLPKEVRTKVEQLLLLRTPLDSLSHGPANVTTPETPLGVDQWPYATVNGAPNGAAGNTAPAPNFHASSHSTQSQPFIWASSLDPIPAIPSESAASGAMTNAPAPLSPIRIPHIMEGSVIVLIPTEEEFEDRVRLIQSAIELGAERVGVFKVKRPEGIPGVKCPQLPKSWPGFEYSTTKVKGKGTYRIERVGLGKVVRVGGGHPTQETERGQQLQCPDFQTAEDAMLRFQDIIERTNASPSNSKAWKTWYGPELDGTNPEVRTALGLSESSPIYPLPDSALNRSARRYDGLHTPWLYIGGPEFGSPFALHKEDGNLYSFNVVHAGHPKIWTCFPKSAAEAVEELVKSHTSCKRATCTQFVRHTNCFLPPVLLDKSGILHCQIQQRAGEVVVTLPGVYHQGFNTGSNLAEAINYWFGDYDPSGYVDCVQGVCVKLPPVTIPGLLPPLDQRKHRKRKRAEQDGDSDYSEGDWEGVPREVDADGDNAGKGRQLPSASRVQASPCARPQPGGVDAVPGAQAKKARKVGNPSPSAEDKELLVDGGGGKGGGGVGKLGRPAVSVDWHEYEKKQRKKCARVEIEPSKIPSPSSLLKALLDQSNRRKPLTPKTADIIARLVMAFGSSEAFNQLKAAIKFYRQTDIGMPKFHIGPASIRDILSNIDYFESATSLFGIMRRVRLYQLHQLFKGAVDNWGKDTAIESIEGACALDRPSPIALVKMNGDGAGMLRLDTPAAKKGISLKERKTLVLQHFMSLAYPHLRHSKAPAECVCDPSASVGGGSIGQRQADAGSNFYGLSVGQSLPRRQRGGKSAGKIPRNSRPKDPYTEQRDILKRRIDLGKSWWRLVDRYGIAVLGLLPSHGEFQVSSSMLETLSVPDFQEFMKQLELQKDCFLKEICDKLKVMGELMLREQGGVSNLPTLLLEKLKQDQILQQPDSSPSFVRFCTPVEGESEPKVEQPAEKR